MINEDISKRREINPVKNNIEKERTYRELLGKYKKAINEEFYFESLLIEYALLEDRLKSMIYYMGVLADRNNKKLWSKTKNNINSIILKYENTDKEKIRISIVNITGKIRIIRCILKWACEAENVSDVYLIELKKQCENIDIGGCLECLENIEKWCRYRNEIIHTLMNKNVDSLYEHLDEKVKYGMELARYIDSQVQYIKKQNRIHKIMNKKQKNSNL